MVKINSEECKGCGVCIAACPTKCLELESGLNGYGAHPAVYKGEGCTGCAICFYCCPEPGAVCVYKSKISRQEVANAAVV